MPPILTISKSVIIQIGSSSYAHMRAFDIGSMLSFEIEEINNVYKT